MGTWTRVTLLILLACIFVFAAPAAGSGPTVLVATIEGVINPVTAEYLDKAISAADEADAQALVIRLDTPGGLDTSMRKMVKSIIGSRVPVVTYVSPSGARAASAGVFILMASHVAAMAPGTNVGAAHPVSMGGGEMSKTMSMKVENDAAAYIRSLAEKRGRNAAWAEKSVRKSVSISEEQAIKTNVADLVADDMAGLLKALDGRKVDTAYGEKTLHTLGAVTVDFDMGARLRFLKAISDPNVAYILMLIGLVGIYFELSNPGLIFPGVVGGVSLVLAFYAFQTLPINYAGLLLIILAAVFFILEAHIVSYGLLTLAGLISLVLGSVMLIDTPLPFMQVSLKLVLPSAVAVAVFAGILARIALRSHRSRVTTGPEGLVGEEGEARTDLDPSGEVFIQGAYWSAESNVPVKKGDKVVVVSVSGLRLKVARKV
jgi:membrane-bound serine protease (ClpP class)